MIGEKTNIGLTGFFRVIIKEKTGEIVRATDWQHNEIIANAPIVISKLLGGQPWQLDRIVAFKAGLILNVAEVIAVTYPTFEEVMFDAVFDEASFTGDCDELQLSASIGATFSKVPDLTFTKTNTQIMGVQWKLKITFCDGLWIPSADNTSYPDTGDPLTIFPEDRVEEREGPPVKNYLIP